MTSNLLPPICSCFFILYLLLFGMHSVQGQQVHTFLTLDDGSRKLFRDVRDQLEFRSTSQKSQYTIEINSNIKFQEIDGFGAAITGSAASNMLALSLYKREELLRDLFDLDVGIGMSMVRHSIGSSDFTPAEHYTYSDEEGSFSVGKDREVIQVLKQIKAVFNNIKIMGSPWSAPGWMKQGYNEASKLFGGRLTKRSFDKYANYLVQYLTKFNNEGLPIWAITPQNEPLHEDSKYPTMYMPSKQQSKVVKKLAKKLKKLCKKKKVCTKIIVYDNNWDKPEYPEDVFKKRNGKFGDIVIGSAFHGYTDDPVGGLKNMARVHESTKRGVWFTELTGLVSSRTFGMDFGLSMRNIIIGATQHYVRGVLYWNMALDDKNGPYNGSNCNNCRGIVTVKSKTKYTKEVEFYPIGHISKFVRPGAQRISSKSSYTSNGASEQNKLLNVAFENVDGSFALVVYNNDGRTKEFDIILAQDEQRKVSYTLAPGSAATFSWKPQT